MTVLLCYFQTALGQKDIPSPKLNCRVSIVIPSNRPPSPPSSTLSALTRAFSHKEPLQDELQPSGNSHTDFQSENNLLQQVNKIKQLGKRKQSAYIKSHWDKSPKISKLFSLIACFSDPFSLHSLIPLWEGTAPSPPLEPSFRGCGLM